MSAYLNSIDVLGAGAFDEEIVGGGVRQWDNHQTYEPGEVVYFDLRFWRAREKVEPPWLTAFMDGEVPGKSDAWYEITQQQQSTEAVGEMEIADIPGEYETVLGAFDIQMKQREMKGLKQVTVGVAQALLGGGQRAIDLARQLSQNYSFPKDNLRDIEESRGKLAWHAAAVAAQAATPQALYAHGDDLKKWVVQAFIEANVAEEGAITYEGMTVGQMWEDMWTVVKKELAKLPAALRSAIAAGIETVTGVPAWAWAVGSVAVLGLLGFAAYKIVTGPAGGAIAGAYLGRR